MASAKNETGGREAARFVVQTKARYFGGSGGFSPGFGGGFFGG
jgi:hypothetical protein